MKFVSNGSGSDLFAHLFALLTNSGTLTVTKVSFLSLQPAQDVSGSKTYVLFGMNVRTVSSVVQLITSFDLISLENKSNDYLNLV